jgi:hypothetical protein
MEGISFHDYRPELHWKQHKVKKHTQQQRTQITDNAHCSNNVVEEKQQQQPIPDPESSSISSSLPFPSLPSSSPQQQQQQQHLVIFIKEMEPASKQPDNRSRLLSVQFSCFSRKEREREREREFPLSVILFCPDAFPPAMRTPPSPLFACGCSCRALARCGAATQDTAAWTGLSPFRTKPTLFIQYSYPHSSNVPSVSSTFQFLGGH